MFTNKQDLFLHLIYNYTCKQYKTEQTLKT